MKLVMFSILFLFIPASNSYAQYQKAFFQEQVNLESGSYRGYAEIQIKNLVLVRDGSIGNLLPADTYYIQMIYYGIFLHPRNELKYKREIEDWKEFDKKELFRSNIVQVDLVDN